MRLSAARFLIPDVAVFHPNRPQPVPDHPPLVAIEVLSPDDRMSASTREIAGIPKLGSRSRRLVDPDSRKLCACEAGLREVPTLSIPELGIEVKPADIFE